MQTTERKLRACLVSVVDARLKSLIRLSDPSTYFARTRVDMGMRGSGNGRKRKLHFWALSDPARIGGHLQHRGPRRRIVKHRAAGVARCRAGAYLDLAQDDVQYTVSTGLGGCGGVIGWRSRCRCRRRRRSGAAGSVWFCAVSDSC